MYTITHHYLTFNDDDAPAVEVETGTWSADDPDDLLATIRRMIEHPGGRAGTTVSLTVALNQPTNL